MTDDERHTRAEPTEEQLQQMEEDLAAHNRREAELAEIKARILAEPARMAALGIMDRHELRKLTSNALLAYGISTGLVEPPGWLIVPGSRQSTDGDILRAAAEAAYAALIPFIKQGANPFDLCAAVMNVALRTIMAAPSPEECADYYKLAIKILDHVPSKKSPPYEMDMGWEYYTPRRSVERKRHH